MRTSEEVLELGLYSCDCCNLELIFDLGDTFCRCPECESLCEWDLEQIITPIEALDDLEIDEPYYSNTCEAVA